MTYLADTHVVLWWLDDSPDLPTHFRDVIADPESAIMISAVTVAEIAIKKSIGKLEIPIEAAEVVGVTGFTPAPLTAQHAARLERLPWLHRDPFDRMLIAQAQCEDWTFLTVDARCREYDVVLLQDPTDS